MHEVEQTPSAPWAYFGREALNIPRNPIAERLVLHLLQLKHLHLLTTCLNQHTSERVGKVTWMAVMMRSAVTVVEELAQ